jgi:isopentenyl diphosphate isomerase/L-lactate dehydrogenase-like FMN-dependent dehydrogenase
MPTVEEWRHRARGRLPAAVVDFVDGGAGDELTLVANRSALDSVLLCPRVLQGAAEPPSTGVAVIGKRARLGCRDAAAVGPEVLRRPGPPAP